MKKEQILKRAIEKAIKNGWKKLYLKDKRFSEYWIKNSKLLDEHWFDIIFSHDFAEAFWGDDWYTEESPEQNNKGYYSSTMDTDDVIFQGMPWSYHLQQMVLKKNPIKYLEKFL